MEETYFRAFKEDENNSPIVVKISCKKEYRYDIEQSVVGSMHKLGFHVDEMPKQEYERYDGNGHFHRWVDNNGSQCPCGSKRCRGWDDGKRCHAAGSNPYVANKAGSICYTCDHHAAKRATKEV